MKSRLGKGPSSGVLPILALALTLSGIYAATLISLGPRIELGAGVRVVDVCATQPLVTFEQNFVTSLAGRPSRITRINVENIPTACNEVYYRLNLYDFSGNLLESIAWQALRIDQNDNAIRAVADGITTVSASISSSSVIYPVDEVNPKGLTLENIDPAQIESFTLETSEFLLEELE